MNNIQNIHSPLPGATKRKTGTPARIFSIVMSASAVLLLALGIYVWGRNAAVVQDLGRAGADRAAPAFSIPGEDRLVGQGLARSASYSENPELRLVHRRVMPVESALSGSQNPEVRLHRRYTTKTGWSGADGLYLSENPELKYHQRYLQAIDQ
jgi:hypothetical protein